MKFNVSAVSGYARRGELDFSRGKVQTPAFMPVGTNGTVKALEVENLGETGSEIILGNTYHLMLRPCLLYTSPSPRDATLSRMPSSA